MGTGMMVPQEYDYEMDAMNFRKREWIHPCDITLKSTESFEDLLKKGINNSLVLMSMYEDYLKDAPAFTKGQNNKSFFQSITTSLKNIFQLGYNIAWQH